MSYKTGNGNQQGYLEKYSGFDAMRIVEKDAEILLLREQLETLKQELHCECQLTKIYEEELKDTERKLRCVENELSTTLALQRLGLDQAKELAQSIVKSKMPVSDSLAKLLSAIYNSTVKQSELAQIKRSSCTIRAARRSARLTDIVIKLKVPSELETRFGELKAGFERFKARLVS